MGELLQAGRAGLRIPLRSPIAVEPVIWPDLFHRKSEIVSFGDKNECHADLGLHSKTGGEIQNDLVYTLAPLHEEWPGVSPSRARPCGIDDFCGEDSGSIT